MLPIGPYEPDKSDLRGVHATNLSNVLPRADGYAPFPSHNILSSALMSRNRGGFRALKSDGTVVIFAGTDTRLFRLNNTDATWVPVSKVTALTSISNASPAVFTLASHGLVAGDPLVLSTSGTLPTGLTVGTVYYVLSAGLTSSAFQVALTAGGTAINTSSAGSGTHSMTYTYTSLSTSDNWQFAQHGNNVVAVQANIAPQNYDLSSSAAFADLSGATALRPRYVSVVLRFLVFSGLEGNPYRVQWSGLNAITTWTQGSNQSDFQDLPDGGVVRGVAGGEFGIIVQDGAIRRMVYAPGSSLIFQIDRVSDDIGVLGPYSVVRGGDRVFFYSTKGFVMMSATTAPTFIGKERVDRTFKSLLDTGAQQFFIAASDPRDNKVFWAFRASGSSANLFDRIISYDWAMDKWGPPIVISGQYLMQVAQPGLTLENLDSINSSIDALGFSLDDVSTAQIPTLAGFNSDNKLGLYSGSNLEATIRTAEQGQEGGRIFVRGFVPVTDATTVYGAIEHRPNLQAAVATTTERVQHSRTGKCPARVETALARAKSRIPAGTAWTYFTGVEPDFTVTGQQ